MSTQPHNPAGHRATLIAQHVEALRLNLGAALVEYQRLIDVGRRKLTALRTADVSELTRLHDEELATLQPVLAGEQQRPAILAQLAQILQQPHLAHARLSTIAGQLPANLRPPITALAVGLKKVGEELQRTNRLVADVAQGLQGVIRGVFAEVAQRGQSRVAYTRDGRHAMRTDQKWIEAVG